MNLEAIANHLVVQGVGVSGQNLFIYRMPPAISEGVLLISDLKGTEIDYELPGFKRTTFQAIVRHTEYVAGRALADIVSSTLTLENGSILGDLLIRYIRPRHEPVMYPVSEGDYLEFSVNFDAVYIET